MRTAAFVSSFRSQTQLESTTTPNAGDTKDSVISDEDDEDDAMLTAKGLLKRDRYVATNRFAVRKGQQAKFEKRWATRKSRLATLPGFRYFHLMRRVTPKTGASGVEYVYDEGSNDEEAQENYVSFTIWDKKSAFSAWRKGDAFKEAHGGTSIGAFLSTMVNSALVLRGAPRPAFYDGLLTQSVQPAEGDLKGKIVDGWRSVEADGVNTLPAECFVALQKYFILPDQQQAFEQLWKNRESTIASYDGFVASSLMRRDGTAKGHGMGEISSSEPNYVSAVVFRNQQDFEKWTNQHEKDVAAKKEKMTAGGAELPKFWNKEPEKVLYEGTLVISSEQGA